MAITAQRAQGVDFNYIAGGDLTTTNNRFAKQTTTEYIVINASSVLDPIVGVRHSTGIAGDPVAVADSGIIGIQAGGSLTSGDKVTTDSGGQAVGTGSGEEYHGIMLQNATAGQVKQMKIIHGFIA